MTQLENGNEHSETLLELVTFDRRCLELSWKWLNDAEIRQLTMSKKITRLEQKRYFDSLPTRDNYAVWGIMLNNVSIIGAAGLKNYRNSRAEYWGYIGEREHWGKGLGVQLVEKVEQKARQLGFSELDLIVGSGNKRAVSLYMKTGFAIEDQDKASTSLYMTKRSI